VIKAETPRMNRTLKMLLPTTLPMAMSTWPDQADCTDTAISGALVPKATTVRPTTRGEIPNDRDSLEAPRTSASAPATRAIRPRANQRMLMAGRRLRRLKVGVRCGARSGRGALAGASSPKSGMGGNGPDVRAPLSVSRSGCAIIRPRGPAPRP